VQNRCFHVMINGKHLNFFYIPSIPPIHSNTNFVRPCEANRDAKALISDWMFPHHIRNRCNRKIAPRILLHQTSIANNLW
jgi:hypothetical protein